MDIRRRLSLRGRNYGWQVILPIRGFMRKGRVTVERVFIEGRVPQYQKRNLYVGLVVDFVLPMLESCTDQAANADRRSPRNSEVECLTEQTVGTATHEAANGDEE
eukprot:2561798-Amphidinium_carterae.1